MSNDKPAPAPGGVLTREEYANEIKDIGKFDYAFGSCRPATERLAALLAHDAALREEVASLNTSLETLSELYEERIAEREKAEAKRDALLKALREIRDYPNCEDYPVEAYRIACEALEEK